MGARSLARVLLLLRGVDGEPLIGHCPSLSRSFFIFGPGAERATPFRLAARTLSGLFRGRLIKYKSFEKQTFQIFNPGFQHFFNMEFAPYPILLAFDLFIKILNIKIKLYVNNGQTSVSLTILHLNRRIRYRRSVSLYSNLSLSHQRSP